MRTITINKAMNGFIVTVGCQTLVFEDADTLLEQLDDYLRNPKATETAYLELYGDTSQTTAGTTGLGRLGVEQEMPAGQCDPSARDKIPTRR